MRETLIPASLAVHTEEARQPLPAGQPEGTTTSGEETGTTRTSEVAGQKTPTNRRASRLLSGDVTPVTAYLHGTPTVRRRRMSRPGSTKALSKNKPHV
jgi:hypothetical protein